jgi:hypothetical protein
MLMPKTAMDEYRLPIPAARNVRLARQFLCVNTKAITKAVNE